MPDDLSSLDATAQAELVRSGEASPAELIEAAIARAEQVNPEINAIIHELYDEARAEAAGDIPDGPFRGVPFVFKDLGAAYAGQPIHLGNRALKEAGARAQVDSYLAQRFRAAGFIVIGKTNTPEFGILPTTEPDAYGPSRNPWDVSRSTGGSSGGSGAATAAGIVPAAHANDGGGSIRIPASANGLVGLKPTRARTTQGPLVGDGLSGLTEELVVSRSVRDTAAILETVHGPAPGDPYVAPAPERPYTQEVGADPGTLRIAFSATPPAIEAEVDAECVTALTAATGLLESLGHELVEASPVDALPPMLAEIDIFDTFLTRWGAGQASLAMQLGRMIGRELTAEDVEPLTWTLIEIGRSRDGGRYLTDVALHQGLSRAIAAWFESGFDLLLTPTMAEPPVPLGTHDDSGPDPMEAFHRARPQGAFTAIFNITGQPAISLPLHWTADGLPVGVQLAAPYGREDLLIRIAAQLERAQPWADRRPPVFAG
jgi:amidase